MYHEDAFLTDTLAVVAHNWVDEFRRVWGLDASAPPNGVEHRQWEFIKMCDEIAARIVAATRTLERSHGNLDELLSTLRENGIDPEQNTFFVHLLEAHLVGDLEDELDRMRLRALKLVQYLVDVRSERVRAYLARVGACFLRGLKTETIVMSGAVIDAALQDLLSDDEIRKLRNIRCGKYISFGNRIEFMKQSGRWDEATVKIAFRLADERNKAVHTSPELARDVVDVVEDLVHLLKCITDDRKC